MNAYSRSMPHLGFDPTPGDVERTRTLARRHAEINHELQQVLAIIQGIDLSRWQGRAGDAMRSRVSTFAPALRKSADLADRLHSATSTWAGKLSTFQAEANALERKAAGATSQHQALQNQQAARPPHSSSTDSQLEAAAANLSGIHGQAEELHQHYLAAAGETAKDAEEHPSLWEQTEPFRKILEAVLAPFDIVAADHWIDLLKEAAGQPSEWLEEVDQSLETVESLMSQGKPASEALIEAARTAESVGSKLDAWEAFTPGWLRAAAGSLAEIRGLSYGLGALGVLADVGTAISPQDSGAMGWVDRGAAGVNGGLLVANMALDEIPVVGEVTLIGTGVYLAGDFLYHHWAPFRNVCNDVGHATVTAVEDTGKAAVAVGHVAGHAWHSVTSTIGSWF